MAEGAIPTTQNDKVRVNASDTEPNFLESKIVSSDGSVDITVSSCDCSLDLSVTGASGFTENIIKATVTFADFANNDTTFRFSPVVFNGLDAGVCILFYKIKHSTKFLGGSVNAATMGLSLRDSTPTDLSNNLDVFQNVTEHNLIAIGNDFGSDNLSVMSHDTSEDLFIVLKTTGDDTDQLTQGEAEVWIKIVTLI